MDILTEKAIALSEAHPFAAYNIQAHAEQVAADENAGKVSPCDNHFDSDFMEQLRQGAHLMLDQASA